MSDKLRLGGMALPNGVLVHGPRSWACAIRTDEGEIKVVARPKRLIGSNVSRPWLRGPARLAEAFAVLPAVKRYLPEARLPLERKSVAASMIAGSALLGLLRRSRLNEATTELVGGALSIAPAVLSLRSGSLTAYHGAEHIAIGSYEHGEPRAKEHERCGSHLVGPLLATTAVGNLLSTRVPERFRPAARLAVSAVAIAASTELFGWMQANPDRLLARALARPGHELQHRLATSEPSADQLAVAEAALAACLELEGEIRT
jgi:uncharacterized protein YqhQ